jgi:DNA-binding IclR family transcriptional regulator
LGKYDLTVQLAELKTTYKSEASGLRKLVMMMEDRETRQKETVNAIERELERKLSREKRCSRRRLRRRSGVRVRRGGM